MKKILMEYRNVVSESLCSDFSNYRWIVADRTHALLIVVCRHKSIINRHNYILLQFIPS